MLNLQMRIVCYFRGMRIYGIFPFLFLLLLIIGCKKDETKQDDEPQNMCIEAISPVGNAAPIWNVEFKWNSCTNGPYTFKLFKDTTLLVDTVVPSNTYLYNTKALMASTSYKWLVETVSYSMDTASFVIQATDSFFVGTYRMHHTHHWYAGPNSGNNDYGYCTIKIVSLGENSIHIQDSVGNGIFSATYVPSTYSQMPNLGNSIYYGYPYNYGNTANLNLVTGAVALQHSLVDGAGGGEYRNWSGYKIP